MIARDYSYQIVTVNKLYQLYKEEIDSALKQQFRSEDLEGMGDYAKVNIILAFFSLYYLNLQSLYKNNDLTIDYDALVQCCSTVQFKDWIFPTECSDDFNFDFNNDFNSGQQDFNENFNNDFAIKGCGEGILTINNTYLSKVKTVTLNLSCN